MGLTKKYRYTTASQGVNVTLNARRPETTAQPQGKPNMEWEEALLEARGGDIPPHSAAYYRRKAARAREIAEGMTTRDSMKARLLDEAVHCDQLADDADLGEGEPVSL